jgi:hypothetical protein
VVLLYLNRSWRGSHLRALLAFIPKLVWGTFFWKLIKNITARKIHQAWGCSVPIVLMVPLILSVIDNSSWMNSSGSTMNPQVCPISVPWKPEIPQCLSRLVWASLLMLSVSQPLHGALNCFPVAHSKWNNVIPSPRLFLFWWICVSLHCSVYTDIFMFLVRIAISFSIHVMFCTYIHHVCATCINVTHMLKSQLLSRQEAQKPVYILYSLLWCSKNSFEIY